MNQQKPQNQHGIISIMEAAGKGKALPKLWDRYGSWHKKTPKRAAQGQVGKKLSW
jgi:hypothetical protein